MASAAISWPGLSGVFSLLFSGLKAEMIKVRFLEEVCGYALSREKPIPFQIRPGIYDMAKTQITETFSGNQEVAVWYLFNDGRSGLTESSLERLAKEGKAILLRNGK